jgi:kumamolisin
MNRKAGLLCCALGVLSLTMSPAICAAADRGFAAVGGEFRPTADVDLGEFTSTRMSIEVALAPGNAAELSNLLADSYDINSKSYHHWLGKGEFYSRFAPDPAQSAAVAEYLRQSGLELEPSSSPFLVRASGPSTMIEQTFRTSIHSYQNPRGVTYYKSASEVQMPEGLAAGVLGVVGLSNTVRARSHAVHLESHEASSSAGCEDPYPTKEQLYDLVLNGVDFPSGYGGGPGCNGLTPSQVNSIYHAPNIGPKGQGEGVELAVFELSAYQHSDIDKWTEHFYGSNYKAPLEDILVDGGPLKPICPTNDQCPKSFNGYSGDIEVDADIETELAIAPDVHRLLVYNAPNDNTGQTSLDEYVRIASDDRADVISSSWGECESDAGTAYVQAENVIFEQMALQGQSMLAAAGDSGAFDCIDVNGTKIVKGTTLLNVDDPPSQPWVTSVGGTSFESFNPDKDPNPSYPHGEETVWNNDGLCNLKKDEGGQKGLFWCYETGAGGGGNSQFWGRPFYQKGPGITNGFTTYGNGGTHCSLAAPGKPCREVPDISANADDFTGYAEYCTGSAATPESSCATFSGEQTPAGWFAIGGTSLSSPLWSAIIADHDGFWHGRIGNANPLLYTLYNLDAKGYFHDITGIDQATDNNGFFPTTPGFDLATGIGTPKMKALITLVPE